MSLFSHEVNKIRVECGQVQGIERFSALISQLSEEAVDLVKIEGYMNLVISDIRVREISAEDKKLRELLGTLAGEFKRVYTRFPDIKSHCSATFLQIL